jgi:hypothetical protein
MGDASSNYAHARTALSTLRNDLRKLRQRAERLDEESRRARAKLLATKAEALAFRKYLRTKHLR